MIDLHAIQTRVEALIRQAGKKDCRYQRIAHPQKGRAL